MKYLYFSICLIFINPIYANLASNAGQILVENFKCEGSSGSEVQNVMSSLNGLKATLSQINDEQKECSDVNAAIGQLPEIDAILRQVENYGVSEEIKEQENIISEALSDLARYKNLSNDEKKLYPSEIELNDMVARARVRLIELTAVNKAKGGTAQRQRYLDGIRQLDVLSQELSFSIKKNANCFEKNPLLKKQVLTGLVGIAGFFAQTPVGIGITLAGRVMQNIFDISDSKQSNINKNFESANQSLLVSGVTCSAEKLTQQHCRLIRQKQLLGELDKQDECSDPTLCKTLLQTKSGTQANKSFDNISKQLANTRDSSEEAVLSRRMLSGFLAVENDFNSAVEGLALKNKNFSASSFKKEQQAEQMKSLLSAFSSLSNQLGLGSENISGIGMGGESAVKYNISAGMSNEDKDLFIAKLIFSEKELENILSQLTQEIASRRKELSNTNSRTTPREEAVDTINILLSSQRHQFNIAAYESIRAIDAKLLSQEIFSTINENFRSISNAVKSKTLVKTSNQKVGEFIDTFYQEQVGQKNSFQEINSIKSFLDNLPAKYIKRQSELMNIDQMKTEIDEISRLAQQIESADKVKIADATELHTKMSRLLDPALGFKDKLAKVVEGSASFTNKELTQAQLNSDNITQLNYLQQKDFLESVYGITDIFEKNNEVNSAIALSAGQIDAYGNFIDGYLKTAVNFLNGKDFEGKNLPSAVVENIDPTIKNKFCLQLTGLTTIPKEILQTCQGSELQDGNIKISFNEATQMSHKDRVCLYHNFKNQIQYQKNKKSSPSNNQNLSR